MNRDPSPKNSRERLKLALIPVLSVVLWLVLRGNRDEPVAELVPPPSELVSPARSMSAGTSQVGVSGDSAITLEQALSHNPFAIPAALSDRSIRNSAVRGMTEPSETTLNSDGSSSPIESSPSDAERRLLEQIAQQEASVVSRGPNGWVAVVDGKSVSVGDWLDSRLQVIRIGPEGVTVAVQATPSE